MLDLDAIAVAATTFHAFCAKMLREYGGEVGWKTDWTILDSDDTRKMMRVCWKDRYGNPRSEEHTSELQSLMRISYAVFCLKKKKHTYNTTHNKPLQLKNT